MQVTALSEGWSVVPPSYRFDIAIEADLIEEVARIMGFEAIPERAGAAPADFLRCREAVARSAWCCDAGGARLPGSDYLRLRRSGAAARCCFRMTQTLVLANPIAADLAVMRVSLWPGLVRAARENLRRQQTAVRLFENANRFCRAGRQGDARWIRWRVLPPGKRLPEQWGSSESREPLDFFDVKADLEALLAATGAAGRVQFRAAAWLPASGTQRAGVRERHSDRASSGSCTRAWCANWV